MLNEQQVLVLLACTKARLFALSKVSGEAAVKLRQETLDVQSHLNQLYIGLKGGPVAA